MTDYRSLETKIRQLMFAEAEARNTKLRMKVTNVGRPDTTENPTDTKSKLAKQGEIKAKIIDEVALDAGPNQPIDNEEKKNKKDPNPKKKGADDELDPKEIKGGKTEVDLQPRTNDNSEDQSQEDKISQKAKNKANKEIGAKGVKEETMTNKLTFGLPESLISAVREVVEAKKMSACPICGKSPCKCDSGGNKDKMKEEVEQVD